MRFPTWLTRSLIALLLIGVIFRFVNVSHKVYWHDEVYTSLRAAGYTRQEIDQTLFQNQVVAASELQRFQQIKPGSSALDTIRSLALEDPQHPPLYFLMARGWMQAFGSSITASRLLPVLLSLLALPAMYGLAWELFQSPAIALLATTLLALSPFDVLFAQTARQYSLLTVMVIVSHYLLLRAVRLNKAVIGLESWQFRKRSSRWQKTGQPWLLYALSVAIGLYTHPFFALTLMGHGVYLVGMSLLDVEHRSRWIKLGQRFGLSLIGAGLLFLPWLLVIFLNRQRALATTNWAQTSPGMTYLVKLWILSFTSLVFDLDFGIFNPLTFLVRVPFLLLIGFAFYYLCRHTRSETWLFVTTSVFVPFLLLAVPDLLVGSKWSSVSRYLISCYPGIQLAIAYLLGSQLAIQTQYFSRTQTYNQARQRNQKGSRLRLPNPEGITRWFWRGTLALVVTSTLVSQTVSAASFTWWNKDLSYFNEEIGRFINASSSPIIVSDIGDDYTNTGDLISLSYRLKPAIPLALAKSQDNWVESEAFRSQVLGKTAIAFRPSAALQRSLEQRYGALSPLIDEGDRLWQVPTQ